MTTMSLRSKVIIAVVFLIAILLTLLPLPTWIVWGRPLWMLMVLSYWGMALENRSSVGIAWLLGLLLDILDGTLLGTHALALCLCIYIVVKWQRRWRLLSLWPQTWAMAFLSGLYLSLIAAVQTLSHHPLGTWYFWLPVVTTPLFWPWVFVLLRDYRRRFNVV